MRKTRGGWAETGLSPIFPAATAPFLKSCASYFRFARFNTFPLYYLRAWHRLGKLMLSKLPVFVVVNQQRWFIKYLGRCQ